VDKLSYLSLCNLVTHGELRCGRSCRHRRNQAAMGPPEIHNPKLRQISLFSAPAPRPNTAGGAYSGLSGLQECPKRAKTNSFSSAQDKFLATPMTVLLKNRLKMIERSVRFDSVRFLENIYPTLSSGSAHLCTYVNVYVNVNEIFTCISANSRRRSNLKRWRVSD